MNIYGSADEKQSNCLLCHKRKRKNIVAKFFDSKDKRHVQATSGHLNSVTIEDK